MESQPLLQSLDHPVIDERNLGVMSASQTPILLERLEKRISGSGVSDNSIELSMKVHSLSTPSSLQDLPPQEIFKCESSLSRSTLSVSGSIPIRGTSPISPIPAQSSLKVFYDGVCNVQLVDKIASLYSSLIIEGKVPNVTSQIHFILQLLTMKAGNQSLQGKYDCCI